MLAAQKSADPNAYGPLDLADDTYDAIWSDLTTAPRWQRVLQRAYLDRIAAIFKEEKATDLAERLKAREAVTAKTKVLQALAASVTSSNGETVFPAWAREILPKLAERLDEAAKVAKNPDDRFHFAGMAARVRHVAQAGQ